MKHIKEFKEFEGNLLSLKHTNEGKDFEGPGLIVVGKTRKDNGLIDQATEESGFYGIYNKRENYWFFPETGDQDAIDKLENELETIFIKKGANVRYEAQYESVVNEGKDDFMARHGSVNINLKKGYKHHTEEELNDLYDKLGGLVKTLKVKDVTLVFE